MLIINHLILIRNVCNPVISGSILDINVLIFIHKPTEPLSNTTLVNDGAI